MTENIGPDKQLRGRQFIPGIAWFFVILVLIGTPGYDFPKVGSWFDELNSDKLIHMGVFGLLAYLFMRPIGKSLLPLAKKKQFFIKITLCTIIWGLCTELIQKYWIPGRSCDVLDWVADSIGAIIAYFWAKKYLLAQKPVKS
ncbi:MAG: hypothetical protein JWQ27_2653 [Ferruginibacter sp.]|nr:hypothetical protein [Ferruginibacter sp.]